MSGFPAGMSSALAVIAHPDDESFGLGALIDTVVRAGGHTAVLCFTRGEASTLGGRREDWAVHVDRRVQHLAIAAHASQADNNLVLRRRLDLLGDTEYLRLLRAARGHEHEPTGCP